MKNLLDKDDYEQSFDNMVNLLGETEIKRYVVRWVDIYKSGCNSVMRKHAFARIQHYAPALAALIENE